MMIDGAGRGAHRMTPRVATGLDVLVAEGFARLAGRRVGLIANPTTVDGRLRHLADLLSEAPGVTLAALFGPEHGIRGDAQDMVGVEGSIDPRTGVPVHSLYGEGLASLRPKAAHLDELDLLIFDVQDVGSRYYTFAATMLLAMEAAAVGVGMMVLDRPNPIGGVRVEGPGIDRGFESFVGLHDVPIRHGMTVGELALLYRAERGIDVELEVVPCAGWRRGMDFAETGLPWVLPSPNMPTPDTARVYPGGCLVEGTNLSEGRGTTRPFELWGAPWLDGHALTQALPGELTAGVILRSCAIRPTFHKHAGQVCRGVQVHVTDPVACRPVALYAALLAAARAQGVSRFAWRTEPYEFVREPIAIDLLFGSARGRAAIEAGIEAVCELAEGWRAEEASFLERRREYLLYED